MEHPEPLHLLSVCQFLKGSTINIPWSFLTIQSTRNRRFISRPNIWSSFQLITILQALHVGSGRQTLLWISFPLIGQLGRVRPSHWLQHRTLLWFHISNKIPNVKKVLCGAGGLFDPLLSDLNPRARSRSSLDPLLSLVWTFLVTVFSVLSGLSEQ